MEALYVGVVLILALASFARGWLRMDVTALAVLVLLLFPWIPSEEGYRGVLSLREGLSGFGSPALAMVAAMFVLSGAMERTGAAALVGEAILRRGARTEGTLQLTVLVVVTLFSGLVSDTTTVLVWMPLLLAVCREHGYASSRLLLPLAYASLLGGQWTLIGTRSNVIASDYLREATGSGLGFLSFTPVAAAIFVVSLAYFFLVGRRTLPAPPAQRRTLAERYAVTEYLTEVLAAPDADIAGKPLGQVDWGERHDVNVLGVVRGDEHLPPEPWLVLRADDVLLVQGRMSAISEFLARPDITLRDELQLHDVTLRSVDLRMVEALVAPSGELVGTRVGDSDVLRRHNVSVLAIGRCGRALVGPPSAQRLEAADSLLLVGHEEMLQRLREEGGLYLLEDSALPSAGRRQAKVVLALLAAVVLTSGLRLLEPAVAMLTAAFLAVVTGCVQMRDVYRSVDWRTLMVLGGMIPMGLALEHTGAAGAVAETVVGPFTHMGPWFVFAALLAVTVLATQLIENAAAAVILAPIAFEVARVTGAEPMPFLLGMAICTSAGFSTPWAHESTLLVLAPGRYEPRHYLALGLPFTAITWGVTAAVVPLLYGL